MDKSPSILHDMPGGRVECWPGAWHSKHDKGGSIPGSADRGEAQGQGGGGQGVGGGGGQGQGGGGQGQGEGGRWEQTSRR